MGCCGSSDKYELEIKVLSASGLPDVDLIGKIDPFINVKYKGEEFKTEVIKGTDSPVWENAVFRVEDAERGQADIIFDLSDWDRFTSNDYVGTAVLRTADQNIPYNTHTNFDLPLTLRGENRGMLKVSVMFVFEGEGDGKEFAVAQQINNSQTYGNSTNTQTTTTNTTTNNNTTTTNTTTVINKTVVVQQTVYVDENGNPIKQGGGKGKGGGNKNKKQQKPKRKQVKTKDGVEKYADEMDEEEKKEYGIIDEDGVDKYAEEEEAGGDEEAAAEEEAAPEEAAEAEEEQQEAVDAYGGAEPQDDNDRPPESSKKVLSDDNIYEFPILEYNTENKWLTSKKERNNNMITIVTQCSIDRLPQLRTMCQSWTGIISCAVYIKEKVDECKSMLNDLFNEIERCYSCILDLSILYENTLDKCDENGVDILYPINHLRNLALNEAKSELVFLLDVDFCPSSNLHNKLINNEKYMNALNIAKKTSLALVVPAFEITTNDTSINAHPRTKAEVINMVQTDNASAFHVKRFAYGHRATNYNFWYKTNEIYGIEYELMYEPYIIIKKDGLRKYDERYRGYGMNKIIHLVGLALKDEIKFAVLPNVFVSASEHEKSKDYSKVYGREKNIIKRNKKLRRKQWLKKLWKISLCELMDNDNIDNQVNTKLVGINVEQDIGRNVVNTYKSNDMLC